MTQDRSTFKIDAALLYCLPVRMLSAAQVNYEMGLVWSYAVLGSDTVSCPICVQMKAADKICLHYIRYIV